jgi:hypothetical protein
MSDEKGLRKGLLDLEPFNPDMKKGFEQLIRELVDGKLSRGARIYWWLFLVSCALNAIPWGYMLIGNLLQGVILWIPALVFAASVLACGFILLLLRGRVNFHHQLAGGKMLLAIAIMVMLIRFFYGMEDANKPRAAFFGIYALAFLVLTCSVNLWNRIIATDLHKQEHLLRLEYRLADLASRLPPCEQPPLGPEGTDRIV